MRKLRVGALFFASGMALIACTRLITEELPITSGGPTGPGTPTPTPGAGSPRTPLTPSPSATATPVPSPTPTVIPTPTPAPDVTATPDPRTSSCVPEPPPLARINVKIHNDQGEKKVLDSAPNVCSGGPGFERFCETIMNDPNRHCCPPRPEGHPQRVACDELLLGRARDTGIPGPTWFVNGKSCVSYDSTAIPRCVNHPTSQFLVFAYGPGLYKACAENGFCGEVKVP